MTYKIKHNGMTVEVFKCHSSLKWVIKIGGNIYSGYERKRDAVAAIGNFI